MNRYVLIRRLTGPAVLLLVGLVALLHEAHLTSFWGLFFPLLLILIGVLKLAERAALAAAGDIPPLPGAYPGAAYPYGVNPASGAAQSTATQGTSIIPAHSQSLEKDSEGGQS